MDRGSLSEPENRLGVLNEPPCAEPHAGWCGGWRLNTSGYPIMHFVDSQALNPRLSIYLFRISGVREKTPAHSCHKHG